MGHPHYDAEGPRAPDGGFRPPPTPRAEVVVAPRRAPQGVGHAADERRALCPYNGALDRSDPTVLTIYPPARARIVSSIQRARAGSLQ